MQTHNRTHRNRRYGRSFPPRHPPKALQWSPSHRTRARPDFARDTTGRTSSTAWPGRRSRRRQAIRQNALQNLGDDIHLRRGLGGFGARDNQAQRP